MCPTASTGIFKPAVATSPLPRHASPLQELSTQGQCSTTAPGADFELPSAWLRFLAHADARSWKRSVPTPSQLLGRIWVCGADQGPSASLGFTGR